MPVSATLRPKTLPAIPDGDRTGCVPVRARLSGTDRAQPLLLPGAVDDHIGPENPVRSIEAFVDSLDLAAVGFDRAAALSPSDPVDRDWIAGVARQAVRKRPSGREDMRSQHFDRL